MQKKGKDWKNSTKTRSFFNNKKAKSRVLSLISLLVLAIALSSLIAVSAVSVNALSTEEIINKIMISYNFNKPPKFSTISEIFKYLF